jgi:hypothetical protein
VKAHLLFEERDFDFDAELPPLHEDLLQDLELPTLLGAMAGGDRFLYGVAARVLLASLDDPGEIRYRQQVLADCLAHPEIVRGIYDVAVRALEDRRGIWGFSSRYPGSILTSAVHQLEAHVDRLRELRRIADDHLEDFRSSGMRTLLRSLQLDLDDDYFSTVASHLRQLKFPDGELLGMELDRDNSGIGYVLRSSGRPKSGWRGRLGLGPRNAYSFTVPPRDEAAADILTDMRNRGINLVANAAAQSSDHIQSYFSMLRAELGFYLGCLNLHDQVEARGAPWCFPDPVGWATRAFSCSDLRDAALVLRGEGPVVGNEVDAAGKSLVVITGANSGGKSTFLRSVGQAHLMAQCGLFVVAGSCRVSVCRAVYTHFIREEDAGMASGRLDEELSRMSAIADVVRPGSLVLFNESFAATNEREGSEIGRQVVKALLEADIRVWFVSHQYDFAEGFHREQATSTLFLRAPRRDDGRRTFTLEVAEPLPTSFGEDVYRRVGGWLEEDDPRGGAMGLAGVGGADRPVREG